MNAEEIIRKLNINFEEPEPTNNPIETGCLEDANGFLKSARLEKKNRNYRYTNLNMYVSCLNRARYYVTTERIDEFDIEDAMRIISKKFEEKEGKI